MPIGTSSYLSRTASKTPLQQLDTTHSSLTLVSPSSKIAARQSPPAMPGKALVLVSRYNFHDEAIFDDTDVFTLYKELFPPHEQDSREDIIRWVLRADLGETRKFQLSAGESIEYTLDSRYFIMSLAGRAIGLGFF